MKRTHHESSETTSVVSDDGPNRKRRRTAVENHQANFDPQLNSTHQPIQSPRNSWFKPTPQQSSSLDQERQPLHRHLAEQSTHLDSYPFDPVAVSTPKEETDDNIVVSPTAPDEMEDTIDEDMFSEQEKATRAIMVQLATGIRNERTYDPVDAKLEDLIRHSRFQAMHTSIYRRESSDISMEDDAERRTPTKSPEQAECHNASMPENTMDVDAMLDE